MALGIAQCVWFPAFALFYLFYEGANSVGTPIPGPPKL